MKSEGRIIIKSRKTDRHGYLRYRTRKNGKDGTTSLGIRVPNKEHFDTKRQRIKEWSSIPYHKEINAKIEQFLREKDTSQKSNELLFIKYVDEKIISVIQNQSTKRTYKTVINLMSEVCEMTYNSTDIAFSNIDKGFITKFKAHLLAKHTNNTAMCYLNRFKALLRKTEDEDDSKIRPNTSIVVKKSVIEIKPNLINKKG